MRYLKGDMKRRIPSAKKQDKVRPERQAAEERSLAEALESTRGIWKSGDGLKYQQKLRDQW